jgi:predicted phage terminase large subunit-like protein
MGIAEKREMALELARREFYHYARIRLPMVYKPSRQFLRDLCERMQQFVEEDTERFMVVNMPPRFCKSLAGQLFSEWQFGQDQTNRIITGSYNERLAGQFSKRVRDSIDTPVGQSRKMHFGDVFPGVAISKGDAASDMWALDNAPVKPSYLATSPGGTATGMGCNLMIIDDLIKNSTEAYSPNAKAEQASWFFNTMMSRLEGDWKVIIIMTRWATDDLAGQILNAFDCVHVDYKAWSNNADGTRTFLCPEILNEESLALKAKEMNADILMANYQQEPVDIQGRLYRDFNEYKQAEVYPAPGEFVYAVTDTADKGSNFLCTYIYIERDGIAYILDYVLSDSQMEVTEILVAQKYDRWGVKVAFTEANNGGRGFARNVRRLMRNKVCIFMDKIQTANKEARIIVSSGWVQQYVWFPVGWKTLWADLYKQIMNYNIKGKNQLDDGVDTLAYVYERCTQEEPIAQTEYASDATFSYSEYYSEPEFAQVEYW